MENVDPTAQQDEAEAIQLEATFGVPTLFGARQAGFNGMVQYVKAHGVKAFLAEVDTYKGLVIDYAVKALGVDPNS